MFARCSAPNRAALDAGSGRPAPAPASHRQDLLHLAGELVEAERLGQEMDVLDLGRRCR